MRQWLTEPLVGFVAIAGVLLAVDGWLRPLEQIAVGPGLSDAVDRAFEAQHGRAPSPVEHDAAVQAWIDDELLYREGLELGLHEGDPVIRRRVIQQVKQIHRASAGEAPTDAELLALRDAWPERYGLPERIGFEHRFFAQDEAGAQQRALDLRGGMPEDDTSRAFPRGTHEGLAPVEALSRAYGADFVQALLEGEGWLTVKSRYGWHAARRTEHELARMPDLDEIRPVLERDLAASAAERAEVDALRRLRGTP